MAISKSKRRYSVSLTPAVVDRFQALARELGMPAFVMSSACEDALRQMSNVFQIAKDKGSIEVSDLMRLMGQQMELIEKEGKTSEAKKKRVA